jgi:hypothetical protein
MLEGAVYFQCDFGRVVSYISMYVHVLLASKILQVIVMDVTITA